MLKQLPFWEMINRDPAYQEIWNDENKIFSGEDFLARIVVREDMNGKLFYDHEFSEIENYAYDVINLKVLADGNQQALSLRDTAHSQRKAKLALTKVIKDLEKSYDKGKFILKRVQKWMPCFERSNIPFKKQDLPRKRKPVT